MPGSRMLLCLQNNMFMKDSLSDKAQNLFDRLRFYDIYILY